MKTLRWQLLIVVLGLIAIAVLLLRRQPAIQAVEPQPEEGGVYTEGLVGSLGRLNPLLSYFNPADQDVNRLLFSSLVRYDERGLPQLDLAESSGISKDGTVYNFTLRQDAVWHDGRPVTSEDVLLTVELLRDPDLPIPENVREFWEQVEANYLDEKTLQFVLSEPYAPFLESITFGILPKHIWESVPPEEMINSEFNLRPVGSGPYRFDRLLVEDGQVTGVILTAFDEYYIRRPFIDQIVFRYYPSAQAALQDYGEGAALGISKISSEILEPALQTPSLNMHTGRLPVLTMVLLNLDNSETPFFQEVPVRQALMHALNRTGMINAILDGQAILADGPVLPGTWAHYDGLQPYNFDSDKAVELLKSAGYTIPSEGGSVREKDGEALRFQLLHPQDEAHTEFASAIQRYWSKIGVQVELVPAPFEELIASLERRDYEAALVDLNMSSSPDPDPYPFWHQAQITGGQNYSGWDDRTASEYLEQARVTTDLEERARLYRNFQVRFNNALPALPLFYPVYSYGVDQQVQGVSMGPLFTPSDRLNTVIDWFMLAERLEETATPTP